MNRRHFFSRCPALATGLAAGLGALAWPAGSLLAAEADEPLVGAPKIIEALTPKDIVLDRPGGAPRPAGRPTHQPSINLQVQFSFDSADLLPHGKRQLDELAMALGHRSLSDAGFMLAGHTDRVGDADYNLRLSLARANAVQAYLIDAHRLSPDRLQTMGYGFARLLNPANPTAAINRRVEVRRLAQRSRTVPASPATGGRLVPTPQ